MFFWFIFQDGYKACTRGYSAIELQHEERKHGKMIRKLPA